jgi:pRiA4b ORF-3-like protein
MTYTAATSSWRVAGDITPPATKIAYTHDFGAGWRHEITLEKVVKREPGRCYPVCVAYKGDSPVEY